MKNVESYQLFQCATPMNSAGVAINGFEIGAIIFMNIFNSPAPSIFADSLSDGGMSSKKVLPIVM